MKCPLILIFAAVLVSACAEPAIDESFETKLTLSGDMLFEGANTLQVSATVTPEDVATSAGTSVENLKKTGVAEAVLHMDAADAKITESLLLQIVSDNHGLATVGTLSPLTEPGSLKLNVSETIDLLPYLRDEGAVWVLDLNISEDRTDEMTVNGKITFRTEYNE